MTDRMDTERLIAGLSRNLRPVRRVLHPLAAAVLWMVIGGAVVAFAVVASAEATTIPSEFRVGLESWHLLLASGTGVAAALAAFELALPDRDQRWALLPLVPAMAWVSLHAGGWAKHLAYDGLGALRLDVSLECAGFILGVGLPLSVLLLRLARHAALLRPRPVAALGGLAAASLASAGLSCVHRLYSEGMVLAWHGLGIGVVILLSVWLGPRIMTLRLLTH